MNFLNKAGTLIIFFSILGALIGLTYVASDEQITEQFRERSTLTQTTDVLAEQVNQAANDNPAANRQLITGNQGQFDTAGLDVAVQRTLEESLGRLRLDQNKAALNELDTILTEYEELDAASQFAIIGGYINYLLSLGNIDTVVQLYERALIIPELENDSLIHIHRNLGQIAFSRGRIDEGVSRFEEYFAKGGEMSKVVSITLARALYNNQDYDRAARYLKEHLHFLAQEALAIDPTRYELSYAKLQDVVLKMDNHQDAVQLSKVLIQQFNNIANWKNLAAIYQKLDDTANLEATIKGAIENDYIDSAGNWIDEY